MHTPRSSDLLSISDTAHRSGLAPSALRYYERVGLITAVRTGGNQRRFARGTLRRLAFVRAATVVGLSLDEIRDELDSLPAGRTPTKADWTAISRRWRPRLEEQIESLVRLRDGLDSCIGCGCLSLRRCHLSNPQDAQADSDEAPGATFLPRRLRPEGTEGSGAGGR